MGKVFGGQRQAETGAAGDVVPPSPLGVRRGKPFGTQIEVVGKPGEEDEQRILFGLTVNHNGDGSDRPKQGTEQADPDSKEFLGQKKNDHRREGTENHVGETDPNLFRHRIRPSRSPVPGIRRRERDRNQRFHQHGVFEVDREIPAKVGAGGLDLVDLIFIQSHSIQSPKAERETKRHNEKQGSNFVCLSHRHWHSVFNLVCHFLLAAFRSTPNSHFCTPSAKKWHHGSLARS